MTPDSPIDPGRRAPNIDVLRGWALLCVGMPSSMASGPPIWIRTDNGHGMQQLLGAEAVEFADIYAFFDAQLPS